MNFSKEEEEIIYRLAEKLTGSSQSGTSRKTVLVHNVMRRMQVLRCRSLEAYLEIALKKQDEYQQLLSALTIHFTNWFRESDVFVPLSLEMDQGRTSATPVRILCAACSTGEEVYSLALFLEAKRLQNPQHEYRIVGCDIDPVSVQTAKRAVYPRPRAKDIPANFQRLLCYGTGKSQEFFTLDKEIRQRVSFFPADLRQLKGSLKERNESRFDAIFCRNVLIYFDAKGVQQIVAQLVEQLQPGGILCVGHSETVQAASFGLSSRGRSIYRLPLANVRSTQDEKVGKILVVDDSLLIRKLLMSTLSKCGFEVEAVESASSASKALTEKAFDLITLDLHMPEVDGITWLNEQRALGLKTPVVILSDASPSEADDVLGVLSSHAQDYIEKKELQNDPHELGERLKAIIAPKNSGSIPTAVDETAKKIEVWKKGQPDILAIGASTGGTEALVNLLRSMPSQSPPLLVVQHISAAFAIAFAERLAKSSGLILGKMMQDEPLVKGHIYLALGDYHIGIKKLGAKHVLDISYSAKEHSVRPAIDYLFRSCARSKLRTLGCVLTGMGKDGALGLLDIKNSNGLTMAQDEASCVVYGMPREAFLIGATQFVGDLRELRREIDGCISSMHVAA